MKRVFIIDDDSLHVFILNKYLFRMNYFESIVEFTDATKAVEQLMNDKDNESLLPDIILLDLNMPKMDGWQFLEVFEKINLCKRPSVFILSSSVMREDHDRAKSFACIDDFFVKPISVTMLENLIPSS